jgi:hypothetical protein
LGEYLKETRERGVFKRFIASQPGLARSRWEYGSDRDRPDFVWPRGSIGVELGEWLHQKQTSRSVQLDGYENEIISGAQRRHLTRFLKSFRSSDIDRYTVIASPKLLPERRERTPTIDALLSFLASAPPPSNAFERRWGRTFGPGDLPAELQPFFASISMRIAGNMNLGIKLNRSTSFDPEDAYLALEKLLHDKLVKKCRLYEAAKQAKGLTRLWFVVHYGRAFGINSPFEGIGIRQGQSPDAATSLQIVVNRAHACIERAGDQPFDRVILFWDFSPRALCFELWPSAAAVSTVLI